MIITKIDNSYTIKLLGKIINVYDTTTLEEITKKVITKINKDYKIKNHINLKFYLNKYYGTIIKLTDYNSPFINKKEKTVKITIHTETPFLYKINYFDINKLSKNKIYYYKNKFYLDINNNISPKEYLNIIELSEIIYEDTEDILDKGIKI